MITSACLEEDHFSSIFMYAYMYVLYLYSLLCYTIVFSFKPEI